MMEISGLFANYNHVTKSTMIYLSIILDKSDYRCLSRQSVYVDECIASFFILFIQMSEMTIEEIYLYLIPMIRE